MRTLALPALWLSVHAFAQPLTVGFNTHYETCSNSNGSVQAVVGGGTPPYTYLWSNSATTDSIWGLNAGVYTLTVTDDLGTVLSQDATVQNVNDIGAFSGLNHAGSMFTTGFGVPCEGVCNGAGAATQVGFYGTPPYAFEWDDPNIVQTGISVQGDPIFYGFCGNGTYTFQAFDANGCSSFASTGSIIQMDSTSFARIDSVDAADCLLDNGMVHISMPGWCAYFDVYQNGVLLFSTGQNMFTAEIGGLGPGVYDIGVRYCVSGCDQWLSVTIPATGPGCGQVDGTVFNDVNGNCLQDAGDVGIPYRIMRVNPVNELVISSMDGRFLESLPPGSYTLEQLDPGLYPICPLPQPVPFTLNGDSATIDLADTTVWGSSVDLSISAGSFFARPGFLHSTFSTVFSNTPTNSGPVTVTCVLDAQTSFSQASPIPTTVNGNTVLWVVPTVAAFAQTNFNALTLIPVGTPLGTSILHQWSVSTAPADLDASNDQASTLTGVTGSYDPNDKTAFTSSGLSSSEYYINQDEYIDYVIRFQNTGTDTAFTVVVVDTLPLELDQSTFQQGAASQPFSVAFKPGRVVEWTFNNILLPDSNTNEPRSHGAVGFRIRPTPPVMPGLVLANAADIFFDFNAPVRTNTSELFVATGMAIASRSEPSALQLFPNPTEDVLRVNGAQVGSTLRILSTDGRLVHAQRVVTTSEQVVVGHLPQALYILQERAANGTTRQARFAVR
ncbi:MAG: T9SS type A sorting domain-containing protein [Flavobacteriales bacterium]|nr:MAG: T9SS type A sorting domain-containing protein [Flavobacteriales bacterium]